MTNEFIEARELVNVYARFFQIYGVWPLQPALPLYMFWIIYCCIQFVLDGWKLRHIFGDSNMMLCLIEFVWVGMVIPKLTVLRFSTKLGPLISELVEVMDEKNFESAEEKECYLAYNRMARKFVKYVGPLVFVSAISHYAKPLGFLIWHVVNANGTVPIITPYETYLFFEFTSYFTLILFWIYQLPMIAANSLHSASLGFTMWLVFQIAGQLHALAARIKNLDREIANKKNPQALIGEIVETHRNIRRISNDMNEVFNLLFLEELFITTVVIILSFYNSIVNSNASGIGDFLTNILNTTIMFGLIYTSCVAGEFLIAESTNVHEAYYQFNWYNIPVSLQKEVIICMLGANKPLEMRGGSFFIFSLPSFMAVIKTALSYVSVLRTMVAE